MLGVGDEKVGPNFGTENLQTQKFLIGLPWIFLGFPWIFPIWFPLYFLDFPGLGKTSQFGLGEANVDALSKNGSTPLLVASREGHTPVCKV